MMGGCGLSDSWEWPKKKQKTMASWEKQLNSHPQRAQADTENLVNAWR